MTIIAILAFAIFQQGTGPIVRPPQPAIAKQESTDTNKQNAGKDKKATEAPPTVGISKPSPNPADQNSSPIKATDKEGTVRIISLPPVTTTRDIPTFVVSLILAGIGIIGIGVAICTLRTISRQTAATETAAKAAAKSADMADRTLHLTQAADVHIEAIVVQPPGILTKDSVITVILKNFGQTRANKITQNLEFGIPGNPALPEKTLGMDLGAGQRFPMTFPCTAGLLAKAAAQHAPFKMWGIIRYYDVFGNGHRITCEGTYDPVAGNWMVNHYEVVDDANPQSETPS